MSESSDHSPLATLLVRGPAGPAAREAVAEYVMANKERIRAIARRKLTASARRVFDSEEVLSSVLRRLDGMAERGTLRLSSEAELWALIEAIARNTAVSKTRLIERARNLVTEDGPYASELLRRLNSCATDDEATFLVHRMLFCLKAGSDRQLVAMVLRGASHRAIGDLMGISEAASRQRWKRVRDELVERFQGGAIDG